MANYNFTILYASGSKNSDADTLTRIPLLGEAAKIICILTIYSVPLAEGLAGNIDFPTVDVPIADSFNEIDWVTDQRNYPVLCRVIDIVGSRLCLYGETYRAEPIPVQRFLREWNYKLFLDHGVV